jgi:GNAT superfamily N-acetyltransferase
MEKELLIRMADVDDINTIGFLAQQIWPPTYSSLLSQKQIDYMMKLFYTPESLTDQIKNKKHQFIMAESDEDPVGFASFAAIGESGNYKIHKLYVLPETQGMGIGKAIIGFITDQLLELNAAALRLNVNRFNPAIKFYQKVGFSIIGEEKTDIGQGFVMDDYVMEIAVSSWKGKDTSIA